MGSLNAHDMDAGIEARHRMGYTRPPSPLGSCPILSPILQRSPCPVPRSS